MCDDYSSDSSSGYSSSDNDYSYSSPNNDYSHSSDSDFSSPSRDDSSPAPEVFSGYADFSDHSSGKEDPVIPDSITTTTSDSGMNVGEMIMGAALVDSILNDAPPPVASIPTSSIADDTVMWLVLFDIATQTFSIREDSPITQLVGPVKVNGTIRVHVPSANKDWAYSTGKGKIVSFIADETQKPNVTWEQTESKSFFQTISSWLPWNK